LFRYSKTSFLPKDFYYKCPGSGVDNGNTGSILMVLQLVPETAAEAVVQLSVETGTAREHTVIESHVHNSQSADSIFQRVSWGAARARTIAQESEASQSYFHTSTLEKELSARTVDCLDALPVGILPVVVGAVVARAVVGVVPIAAGINLFTSVS
jgi:hypothetical protein